MHEKGVSNMQVEPLSCYVVWGCKTNNTSL